MHLPYDLRGSSKVPCVSVTTAHTILSNVESRKKRLINIKTESPGGEGFPLQAGKVHNTFFSYFYFRADSSLVLINSN
jgi:hypothetical protein